MRGVVMIDWVGHLIVGFLRPHLFLTAFSVLSGFINGVVGFRIFGFSASPACCHCPLLFVDID